MKVVLVGVVVQPHLPLGSAARTAQLSAKPVQKTQWFD